MVAPRDKYRKNMDLKQYLIPFFVGVALIACGIVTYQIGRAGGYQRGYDDALALPHKADTVWQDKPVYIDKPVPVVQWRDREKLVYVSKDSLIYVHDTVPALPREFKQYSGEEYEAVVSGVEPALESLKIFKKEMVVTNTITQKKKWSFSVVAGPSVLYNGEIYSGFGVTLGFGYNF